MKIQIKPLADAINKIGRITNTDLLALRLSKKQLTVTGENGGRSFTVTLPHEDEANWEISIPKKSLDQTFKGRKELDIAVTTERGQQLRLSANSFVAEFATHPYTGKPELARENASLITGEQQAFMDFAYGATSIPPIYEVDTLFFVDFKADKTTAACFDPMYFCLVESEPLNGEPTSFAFPTKTFGVVLDAAGESNYKMATTSASICCWNKTWQLVLPFVQSSAVNTLDDVLGLTSSFGKGFARCSTEGFATAVEAASTAIEAGGVVKVVIGKTSLQLSASSAIGSVSESIEFKRLTDQREEFHIDPNILLPLLHNVPTEFLEFGVHDSKLFFIRVEHESHNLTYVGRLSSPK